MQNNASVTTTTVTQTANQLLGTKEKTLYYLIIETPKGKLVINVGNKTHEQVQVLTDKVTNMKFATETKQIGGNQ